jgi:hypothetical protein
MCFLSECTSTIPCDDSHGKILVSSKELVIQEDLNFLTVLGLLKERVEKNSTNTTSQFLSMLQNDYENDIKCEASSSGNEKNGE